MAARLARACGVVGALPVARSVDLAPAEGARWFLYVNRGRNRRVRYDFETEAAALTARTINRAAGYRCVLWHPTVPAHRH